MPSLCFGTPSGSSPVRAERRPSEHPARRPARQTTGQRSAPPRPCQPPAQRLTTSMRRRWLRRYSRTIGSLAGATLHKLASAGTDHDGAAIEQLGQTNGRESLSAKERRQQPPRGEARAGKASIVPQPLRHLLARRTTAAEPTAAPAVRARPARCAPTERGLPFAQTVAFAVASLEQTSTSGASGSCGWGIAASVNSAIAPGRKTRQ